MSRRAARQRGFTLIEVLIVTVVIGIIGSIAIVSLAGALDRAKQRATMADMRTVARCIEAYEVDNHLLPDASGGLSALIPVLIPYQTNVLPTRDHWGRELAYTSDGATSYTIESYGRDGVAGAGITYETRFEYDRDIVLVDGRFIASPE